MVGATVRIIRKNQNMVDENKSTVIGAPRNGRKGMFQAEVASNINGMG